MQLGRDERTGACRVGRGHGYVARRVSRPGRTQGGAPAI